jgi:tetratricopeptide (TPR) repeat protein
LLLDLARTMRGFVSLDLGEPESAEADARTVLDAAAPQDVLDAAQVGPLTLLAKARQAQGDPGNAIDLLRPVAADPQGPSLVFPRRHAVAVYASALLDVGQVEQALAAAVQAKQTPGEDVRSEVCAGRVLARALAGMGRFDEARVVAREAVLAANRTQQLSERNGANAVRDRLISDCGCQSGVVPS